MSTGVSRRRSAAAHRRPAAGATTTAGGLDAELGRIARWPPAAWSRLAVGLAALLLVVGGCSSPSGSGAPPSVAASASSSEPAPSASDSGGPGASGTPVVAASPVAGIVVAVESAGLDQVKGFTLRTNNGDMIVFMLGTLDNADEFPPGHLKEHQASAAPVFVFFREENGQLVAYHIEDAP